MKLHLGVAIAACALGLSSFLHPSSVVGEAKPTTPAEQTQTTQSTSTAPAKHLKIAAAISNVSDLKVKAGDRVKVGDLIAERTTERTQLEAQRQGELLALQKLEKTIAPIPPQLRQVPAIAPLPPANYATEYAAIQAAQVKLDQTKRQYNLYQQADPRSLVETAALDLQSVNARQTSEAVINQAEKVAEVQDLAELPPEVVEHENKVLEKLKDSSVKANAELELKQSEVKASLLAQQTKLQQLKDEIGQAETNLNLAYSKLEQAKNNRAHLEYQHTIELSRATIEKNQAIQENAKAQRDLVESERKRILDIQGTRDRIAAIDTKLGQLAVYHAPIDAIVKRVHWIEQDSSGLLKLEIILSSDKSESFSPKIFPEK